ncbi:hypothetical protein M0R45_024431 [Rubus argutus]|uniref:Uncharacterized protein n=1 Tax=Rubus argutus TaxID=59490 RepID=A0AAW1WUA0_RUBAR
MDVDVLDDTMTIDFLPTSKRRRLPPVSAVSEGDSAQGTNLEFSIMPITALPGNIQKDSHACQSSTAVDCAEDGQCTSLNTITFGGIFGSVSGSVLNFQQPSEEIKSTVDQGSTTLAKPNLVQTQFPAGGKPMQKRQGKRAQSKSPSSDIKLATSAPIFPLSNLNTAPPKSLMRKENLQIYNILTNASIPTKERHLPCQTSTSTAIGALSSLTILGGADKAISSDLCEDDGNTSNSGGLSNSGGGTSKLEFWHC